MSSNGSSSFYAAIWLPQFQLQVVLRTRQVPRGAAAAVLDCDESGADAAEENKSRILHANQAAQRRHVEAGMTPSQALARCGGLLLWRRNAEEEAGVQQMLLQGAAQWTPDYESSQPGLCVLDLSHVREARQRAATCGREMKQWLEGMQLEARIGLAPDADLACLAARAAQPVLVLDDGDGKGSDWLARLPMAALQPSRAIAEVLETWGIHSLADFAALSREDIAARLGVEGALLWDVVKGDRGRLLRLARPSAGFREAFEFEHPVEMIEPLLFMLQRLLGDLCLRLAEAWLLASAVSLGLWFEDKTDYERTLRVAEPTRDAGLLLRVLHTHLDGRSAGAPIIAVSLELTPARPANQQTNLFERRLRDPNQFSETLARLEALLGRGNVGRVQLLPSRRPDAFTVVNYLDEKAATENARQKRERVTHGLPLRCFRPPKRISVVLNEGRPESIQAFGKDLPVTEAWGPWRMSGDWWDRHAWAREVWEIATTDGALYQLAREKRGWVLDGTFG
jgi:protein ImuB